VAVLPADERPHEPSGAAGWAETWSFDYWLPEEEIGGVVEFTWAPGHRRAWYAAALVGPGRPYVLVVTDAIPMAVPSSSLEFRHEEIWAQHVCETPLDHWTIGLEAYGVALDRPDDALTRPWGDRTGLGYDLEWEAAGSAEELAAGSYRQPCRISGEVLVGHEEHPCVVGIGWRRHRWGPWVAPATGWYGFWTEDGEHALDGRPHIDDRATVVAEAPVAVDGPDALRWRERRTLIRSGDAVGWIGRPAL
jgi:hypothetical protein